MVSQEEVGKNCHKMSQAKQMKVLYILKKILNFHEKLETEIGS